MSSIHIRFPDQRIQTYPKGSTGLDIATSISPRLAETSVAIIHNEQTYDLSHPLTEDGTIEILTRGKKDPRVLEILRHDAAHIMAEAVQKLYPHTKLAFGPTTEYGFYYDFGTEHHFTPEDLSKIETEMRAIIASKKPFLRQVLTFAQAQDLFKTLGEDYKTYHLNRINKDEKLTTYSQGTWLDLCRGPHGQHTGQAGSAFKLTKVSGAYWLGDKNNDQLQRIYGVLFEDNKDLTAYETMLAEAERRDHRIIGPKLGLFHLQDNAPGSIFWHPHGWHLYRRIENYIRNKLQKTGYVEVRTPQLLDSTLWQQSGHWEKYHDNMFTVADHDKRILALKPMNCPGHVQIFNQGLKSYRDLPLRMAEFGSCHRNESSGALHGIMRVRAFTQDDAHIFCEEDQINSETVNFCDLLKQTYKDFGFTDIFVKFSDRPEKRAGTDQTWDRAEHALKNAIEHAGIPYIMNPGEGAFYGPKLEFVLKDALGRDWQCGTLQVDFILPERLDATYVAKDGSRKRPVMLHRAILGSFERFIGILIEHYEGKFPLWLAPRQVVVASITTDVNGYAQNIHDQLKNLGLASELDDRNEKISYKIREHHLNKVPIMLIVGRNEQEQKTVTWREGNDQKTLSLDEALASLVKICQSPY